MGILIGSAAFFKVSASGIHGRIVLAGGAVGSQSVCSKQRALLMMDAGVERGLIIKDEVPGLRQQIMDSSLPRHEEDVNTVSRLVGSITDLWETKELLEEDESSDDRRVH